MKKYKIIANPKSGDETALDKIQNLIELMAQNGCKIDLRLTGAPMQAYEFAKEDEGEDIIISIGGDGTLNEVVNGIVESNKKVKLAIISSGTVNDFATAMEIPTDIYEIYEMLIQEKTKKVDVGMAGDKAFINVAAGGLMTDIAYTVTEEKKTILGRTAYYIEGLKEFAKLGDKTKKNHFKLKIKTEDLELEEDILVFICANSMSVGGFEVAPHATVDDGLIDILMVKDLDLADIPKLVRSFTKGKHTAHEKIVYLQAKEFTLDSDEEIIIDVDGEKAGKLPMTFKVKQQAIELIVK